MSQIKVNSQINAASTIKIVKCPHCETSVEWIASSAWRPFCSERCKIIDLGAWASEEYSVASEKPSPLEDIDYNSTFKD